MPRKRKQTRSAWASLTEVQPDVWRLRYWAAGPDGYKRRSKTIRGSRLDAERVRSELMLEHSEDAPCPTVAQAWERWVLPDMEQRVATGDLAPKSLEQYSSAWRKHVEPTWGSVACDAVRPLRVQQWIGGMGRSPAISATQVLSKVMDYAVRYEFCDHNPMREKYLMPSPSTIEKQDPGIWDVAQLMDEWDACRGAWYEPAFILAAFGGCRVSESVGPMAGEVERMDVDGVPLALVPIVRQVTKETGVSDRLKTESSRRTVIVPGRAALALEAAASALPADWPLTHDGAGAFVSRDRLNRAWRLDVLPSLPEGQRHIFQNLRNSWQTNCRWTLGMAPWLVESLMGHVGAGVTGRHYDRPQTVMFAETVARAYAAHPYDAAWDDLGSDLEAHTL